MWSQPKFRWTVRTDRRLPTRGNQHGHSLHNLKNPGKVTSTRSVSPEHSLWLFSLRCSRWLGCTLCQPPYAVSSSISPRLHRWQPSAPGHLLLFPHSLMLYHILYWLLGTLVKVTRQGYRKLEKNPFSEGVRCYREKNRLTAIQHNGCDASSEAVLWSNAPREGTWPQEKNNMRRGVQRTDKGCTSGCDSPRVTVTVCQEVASYWEEAEALPFHSLVSEWENQRHTDMELLTVMSGKKRTQRQRVRLQSIFIE